MRDASEVATVQAPPVAEGPHPLDQLDGVTNTFTGKKFNILNPEPGQFCLRDIAQGLGYKPHFSGQTPFFFSIASHCHLALALMPEELSEDPFARLVCLLHDAAEAYIGDMIKPLKIFFPVFEIIENNLLDALFLEMNITPSSLAYYMREIKIADKAAQKAEFDLFYNPNPRRQHIVHQFQLPPDESAREFVSTAVRLMNEVQAVRPTFRRLIL